MLLQTLRDEDHAALDVLEDLDAGRAQVSSPVSSPELSRRDAQGDAPPLEIAAMLGSAGDGRASESLTQRAALHHAVAILDGRVRAFAALLVALDREARETPPAGLLDFHSHAKDTRDEIAAVAWSTAGARILAAASLGATPDGGIASVLGVEPSSSEGDTTCWPPGDERPLALPVPAAAVPWLDAHAARWRDCVAMGRDEGARGRVHARALVAAVWPCGPGHRRDLLLALRGGRDAPGDVARCAALAALSHPDDAYDPWLHDLEGREAGATPNPAPLAASSLDMAAHHPLRGVRAVLRMYALDT